MALTVRGMDHIVLRVADAEISAAWYRDQLGLEPVRLEEWRRGEAPFVSMRVDDRTIIDLQQADRGGSGNERVNMDHVALVVEESLDDIIASGDFEVIRGPNRLFGAQGWGHGIYVNDPDGNVVEFRVYD